MNRTRSMDGALVSQVIEVLITPDQLPSDGLHALDLGPEPIAVLALRSGDDLRLWHNACPHAGRRLDYAPGQFLMQGGRLVCAAHGAQIDVNSGRCVDGPGRGGQLAAIELSREATGWRVRLPLA